MVSSHSQNKKMNKMNFPELEVIVALIYTAAILTAMEYFLIPPRMEFLLQGRGVGGWVVPSLDAGLGWVIGCVIGFAILPMIFLKFCFQKSILDHGFSRKQFLGHMKIYLGMFVMMLPFIYMASLQPDFRNLYPFVPEAKKSLDVYITWELAYVLQFFCLEFFFRGYLLYTLERHMNKFVAIAVMVVPYTMIHFHKPYLETFGAIIAGSVLGYMSLKYRSWWGGAILHALVALTIDFLSSKQAGLF